MLRDACQVRQSVRRPFPGSSMPFRIEKILMLCLGIIIIFYIFLQNLLYTETRENNDVLRSILKPQYLILLLKIFFYPSYDGVPFLMFDRSLLRTTNVDSVFSNGTSDDPVQHTMADLLMLSAGSWFLEVIYLQVA